MSDLKTRFDDAVARSKTLTRRPDNATLLKLYASYKQASLGDATGARPDVFDLVATAKFDAWDAIQGTSRDDAMAAYVELIDKLSAS